MTEVEIAAQPRRKTQIEELDRVLGGGLVPGAVVLLAGDPGLGKSTLLLQAADALAASCSSCLYVSGEESLSQLALRGQRLGVQSPHLMLLSETDAEVIAEHVDRMRPELLVVDSIQAMFSRYVESLPGSVGQVRECATRLAHLAKDLGVPTVLVGHVTKDGVAAGPRLLEHMVDTVLYLEGERYAGYRVLRAVKNRFGSTDEVGLFAMEQDGLRSVPDASVALLAQRKTGLPGSSVTAILEGSRPILVEVQALASEAAPFGAPRRSVNGLDFNRACLVIAVLEKRARIPLGKEDIFINVPGGVRISEPAADLGLAVAIASSVKDQPAPADMAFLGEIGLTGEVRSVPRLDQRLAELARHGFLRCVTPRAAGAHPLAALELIEVEQVDAALGSAFCQKARHCGRGGRQSIVDGAPAGEHGGGRTSQEGR